MSAAIKQVLSPKAIVIAVGSACLLYGVMLCLSLFGGAKALQMLESKMAAQNIAFERSLEASQNVGKLIDSDRVSPEPKDDDYAVLDAKSLAPAPFDGLTEESLFGDLPIVGKNKLKPFDAYKKPIVLDNHAPVIAIGVTGVGLSNSLYESIFRRLSPNASIILSPYAPAIHDIQKAARKSGYEVWLSMPFETKQFPHVDPGSKAILANVGLKFNQDNYKSILASTSGYVGIAGYTDKAFEDSKPMLTGILGEAFMRGLGFFEMNSGRDSMSRPVAVSSRTPYVRHSLRLSEESIKDRFTAFKRLAKRNGEVVAVVEVNPAMLKNFQKEVMKAEKEGFQIVPLSALAKRF